VAAGYSIAVNGVDELAIMLLDVLSGLEQVGICTGYQVDGEPLGHFIADAALLGRVEPEFEMLPGWSEDVSGCTEYGQLPANARAYLSRLEELLNTPIGIVSVGPDRKQTLVK
jgi:adenylosuccinate synthase